MALPTSWLPKPDPHFPPDHTDEVVLAIRALESGTANSAQQQLAWRYLMYVTGASEEFADMSYRPDSLGGRRASDFAEGKRFVGLMIRKLLRPEFTPQAKIASIPETVSRRLAKKRQGRKAA